MTGRFIDAAGRFPPAPVREARLQQDSLIEIFVVRRGAIFSTRARVTAKQVRLQPNSDVEIEFLGRRVVPHEDLEALGFAMNAHDALEFFITEAIRDLANCLARAEDLKEQIARARRELENQSRP